MNLRKTLSALVSVITEEAERSDLFRANIERALGIGAPMGNPPTRVGGGKGRRTPAVLDPVELVRQGEGALREQLSALTLDQLRDIVAQYGMDPSKLVMKWKDLNRIKTRIVELSLARATKGDAFRSD
jgi:hypothetical protein